MAVHPGPGTAPGAASVHGRGRVCHWPHRCMKRAGIAKGDLIDGATTGKPALTLPALMEPGVKVLSY